MNKVVHATYVPSAVILVLEMATLNLSRLSPLASQRSTGSQTYKNGQFDRLTVDDVSSETSGEAYFQVRNGNHSWC